VFVFGVIGNYWVLHGSVFFQNKFMVVSINGADWRTSLNISDSVGKGSRGSKPAKVSGWQKNKTSPVARWWLHFSRFGQVIPQA